MNTKYFLPLIIWCMLNNSLLLARQKDSVLYQEKFIQTNGVNLHYLDFGGSGVPIIFLQSYHDDAREWVDFSHKGFAPRFTATNRVFAITRRGWGKSSDPGWGFDVPTNGEDVLGFMDALNLQKAVMVGRIPASQDMTWIAEHHPERVAGLVYWDFPFVTLIDLGDTLFRKFDEMLLTLACDLYPHAIRKAGQRSAWRPHFLQHSSAPIQVPAMWFALPDSLVNIGSREMMFFDQLMAGARQKDFTLCDPEAANYFKALAQNDSLQQYLRTYFETTKPFIRIIESFKKAFSPALTVIQEQQPPPEFYKDPDAYWLKVTSDMRFRHMQEFLKTLPK